MPGSDVGIGDEAAQAARQESDTIKVTVEFNKSTGQMRVDWPQGQPMRALGLLDMMRDFILTQMKGGGGDDGGGSSLLRARGAVPRNPQA